MFFGNFQGLPHLEFREDLFFRLNTFALQLQPLRERGEDIPQLSRYFHDFFRQKYSPKSLNSFTADLEKWLIDYNWPGIIRELKNVIERCVVLENKEMIGPEHLPLELSGSGGSSTTFVERRKNARLILPEAGISLDEVEKDLITQALERAGNNQTKAAKLLDISYDSLRYQVKKFDLK